MQQIPKHVNYVEVEAAAVVVIGLHKDIMHNNRVHAHTHVHLEVVWAEQPAIEPVVMEHHNHVHVHGIVPLVVLFLVPHVIHKVVMELEQLVLIHVLLEVLSVVLRVTFPKEPPIHIHVIQEVPYQVPLVHFLPQERHNMDVSMVEHKAAVYVSYPQDNA